MEVTASRIASTFITPFVIPRRKFEHQSPSLKSSSEGLNLRTQFRPFNTRGLQNHAIFAKRYSIICCTAHDLTCAAEREQSILRNRQPLPLLPFQARKNLQNLMMVGPDFLHAMMVVVEEVVEVEIISPEGFSFSDF
ncbi:hypothetical protein Leryth_015279 [Lithospermum erythrorhizon]|nr:hypothetical protein Leryth_015279 [Lithospermum erythrorhizon]